MAKRFLSYLPSSVYETPPVLAPDPSDPIGRREEELFTIIPRRRTMTFDMRRAIHLMADRGSFFEIGPLWARTRLSASYVSTAIRWACLPPTAGINGGALTADGCDKFKRHLDCATCSISPC